MVQISVSGTMAALTVAALTSVVSAAPKAMFDGSLIPTTVELAPAAKPTCDNTPAEFWSCISDCLYKVCRTGDDSCIKNCDYKCGMKWVPGFPNCDPGSW